MRYLTADEILALHCYLMRDHWGEPLYGLRDRNLLESAASRPQTAATYGQADVFDQAARLWHGVTANHPFVQGNKRIAFAAMELFLRLNGWTCIAIDEELVEACLDLAMGRLTEDAATIWLRAHVEQAQTKS